MDEKQTKQFHFRTWVMVLLMGGLLLILGYSMYQTQIVHGADWRAQTVQKIANFETVPSDRGDITDCYGQVLVTNRVGYQVRLDTSRMGDADNRNRILLELLAICRRGDVAWNDSLPISAQPPFVYTTSEVFYYQTTDSEGKPVQQTTRLYRLAVKMKWITEVNGKAATLPTAEELLGKMCASFGLQGEGAVDPKNKAPGQEVPLLNIGDLDPAAARDAAGVLYELYLRSKDVERATAYTFARDVDIDFIAQVKERSLGGVIVETTSVRQYNTDYAAHILGRVALMDAGDWEYYKTVDLDGDGTMDYQMNDTVGKEGVEKAFEAYLRGTAGRRRIELNTNGKTVSEEWTKEPEAGGNVVLTLDLNLQRAVEDILAEYIPTINKGQTEGAACVVVDMSGGVLAMGSYPTYNLSTYAADLAENSENPLNPYLNRATMGAYAPGSTFKMVTGIAGLEEGIITPTSKILDTGRYTYYSANGPMCWIYRQGGGTHGLQNVSDAIKNSCNVFFYDVGRQLGIELLQQYASQFGLGESTGIEIPERTGVMAGPAYTASQGQTWYLGNVLSVAIGQESSQFTPLQLANYVATLVNGGTHYQAHLLKEVRSNDYTQVLYEYEPVVLDQLELANKNLEAVKKGMLSLTTSGSLARYFRDLGFQVGAKTGSAQLSATTSDSNAVLVCFAPYDNPQIAIAIVAEKGGTGSELGAVAAEVFRYYFAARSSQDQVTGENTLVQ